MNRKITTDYKHINCTVIKGTQAIVEKQKVYAAAMLKEGYGFVERIFEITPHMAKRINENGESIHNELTRGIRVSTRFNSILLQDKDTKKVVGAHMYPTIGRLDTDAADDMNLLVMLAPEDIVVQFHESGEIDVLKYDSTYKADIVSFIKELEKLDKIEMSTCVNVKKAKISVRSSLLPNVFVFNYER